MKVAKRDENQKSDRTQHAAKRELVRTAKNLLFSDESLLQPAYPVDLVNDEEKIWTEINKLNASPKDEASRVALSGHYSALAMTHAKVGDFGQTQKYVQKALEYNEGDHLSLWLARTQALNDDFRFIGHFQKLLEKEDRPEILLEFCFFLEMHEIHNAGLDAMESFLKKNTATEETIQAIQNFLSMIEKGGDIHTQQKVEDYLDLFERCLPADLMNALVMGRPGMSETIIGRAFDEEEEKYGLDDDILETGKYILFIWTHYRFHTTLLISAILLLVLASFGMPPKWCRWIGTTIWGSLSLFILFQFIKIKIIKKNEFRDSRFDFKSRIAMLSLTTVIIAMGGGFMARLSFIHEYLILFIFLEAIIGIVLSALAAVRNYINRIASERKYVSPHVAAHTYSRMIANILLKCTFFIFAYCMLLIVMATERQLPWSIVIQSIFFFVLIRGCASLFIKQKKKNLRDHTLVLALVLFLCKILHVSGYENSIVRMAMYMNVDSIVLLIITCAFAYRHHPLPVWPSVALFIGFTLSHFYPWCRHFLEGAFFEMDIHLVSFAIIAADLVLSISTFAFLLDSMWSKITISSNQVIITDTLPSGEKSKTTKIIFAVVSMATMYHVFRLSHPHLKDALTVRFWVTMVILQISLGFLIPYTLLYLGLLQRIRIFGAGHPPDSPNPAKDKATEPPDRIAH